MKGFFVGNTLSLCSVIKFSKHQICIYSLVRKQLIWIHFRKLKNRVAAQTARDRKKAHMEDLETCLARIEKEVNFFLVGHFNCNFK